MAVARAAAVATVVADVAGCVPACAAEFAVVEDPAVDDPAAPVVFAVVAAAGVRKLARDDVRQDPGGFQASVEAPLVDCGLTAAGCCGGDGGGAACPAAACAALGSPAFESEV